MMRSALDRALRETPDYERLESLLKKGGGPLAVLNLQNVHKAHLLCALSESMPVLAVAASEAQAAALRDLASAFGAPARLFLPRDIPLVHVMDASWERSSARIAALSSLLRGGEGPVITCVSALMQKLQTDGRYELPAAALSALQAEFSGAFADDATSSSCVPLRSRSRSASAEYGTDSEEFSVPLS